MTTRRSPIVGLIAMLVPVFAACSGPAVCVPWDDGCRRAAHLLVSEQGFEAVAVRDVLCDPRWDPQPVRCLEFVGAAGGRLGAALFADGVIAPFEP